MEKVITEVLDYMFNATKAKTQRNFIWVDCRKWKTEGSVDGTEFVHTINFASPASSGYLVLVIINRQVINMRRVSTVVGYRNFIEALAAEYGAIYTPDRHRIRYKD